MKDWKIVTLALAAFIMSWGCKKEITQQTIYDNVIYEVNPVTVYASSAEKTKQKSPEQFISILYSNLTNKTIPGDDLNNLSELSLSFGDKELMNQVMLENFLGNPGIDIPTNDEMRSNPDAFVNETYLKFFLRIPTAYENYFLKDLISKDEGITPEMVYAAFAQSNEYLFY